MAQNQDWMKEKENEYKKLNDHIQNICLKNNMHKNLQTRQLMVDKRHKIAFCRNAKVGTSTWMKHFALLDQQKRYEPNGKIDELFPQLLYQCSLFLSFTLAILLTLLYAPNY